MSPEKVSNALEGTNGINQRGGGSSFLATAYLQSVGAHTYPRTHINKAQNKNSIFVCVQALAL